MPSLCTCLHGTADPQPTHSLQHWQHIMSPQGLSSKRLQQLPKKAPLEQLSQSDLCPSLLSELAQPWSVSQPCATGLAELAAFHCHPWRGHSSLAQVPPWLGQKKPQKIRKGHQNPCAEQQQHEEQRLGALAAQDKSKTEREEVKGNNSQPFPKNPALQTVVKYQLLPTATFPRSRGGSSTLLTPATEGTGGAAQRSVRKGPRAKSQQHIKQPDTSYRCHRAGKKWNKNKIKPTRMATTTSRG